MTKNSEKQNAADEDGYRRKVKSWTWDRLPAWSRLGIKWFFVGLDQASPFITAIATAFLVWVAFLQWITLNNTDHTLTKTMVNGQRAYLIIQNAKITAWTTPTNGTTLSYDVVNIGATPAYDVRQALYIDLRKPPVTNYNGIPWTRTNDINYVGKGFSLNSLEGPYLDKDKILGGSIRSGNDRLYFIGRLDYRDVFNIDHWTDFCFMYLGDTSLRLSNCDYLNEADQEGKNRN